MALLGSGRLPRSDIIGTPGINPGAKSPITPYGPTLPPSGIGSPTPTPPVPATTDQAAIGPDDLSDLRQNPISNFRLGLGDAAARVLGNQGPTERIMQQRRQQLQARQQSLQVTLGILGAASQYLDRIPIAQRGDKLQEFREAFSTQIGGPGSEALVDAFLSDPGTSAGQIAQASDDEGLKALLANPLTTVEDIRAYTKSPDFIQRAVERQDSQLLGETETRVNRLLEGARTSNPELYRKIQADGKVTPEEIKQLNENATDGEEGSRLTPALLGTLDRQQDKLAQRIPGFQTSQEFSAARELKVAEGVQARQLKAKEESQIRFEQARAGLKPPKAPTAQQSEAAGYARIIEQALADFQSIDYDRSALSSGLASSVLPNFMKSGDLQRQEQAERKFVNAVLRRESGAVISESEFANAEQQYFPRAGNSPEVLAQKARNRVQVLENLRSAAGPALEQTPSVAQSLSNQVSAQNIKQRWRAGEFGDPNSAEAKAKAAQLIREGANANR